MEKSQFRSHARFCKLGSALLLVRLDFCRLPAYQPLPHIIVGKTEGTCDFLSRQIPYSLFRLQFPRFRIRSRRYSLTSFRILKIERILGQQFEPTLGHLIQGLLGRGLV